MKKTIKVKLLPCVDYKLEGSLKDAIDFLVKTHKEYSEEGYSNLRLENIFEHEYSEIELFGERLENDIEYDHRIKKEKMEENAAKEKEIEQLKKLKEKYPNI